MGGPPLAKHGIIEAVKTTAEMTSFGARHHCRGSGSADCFRITWLLVFGPP
jgi:hypothetical protein